MNDVAKMRMPMPPRQTQQHQLHPAAAQAAAIYSEALMEADRLKTQVSNLESHLEAAQRHCHLLEQRLDREISHKEMLQRYSVELRSHLDGIGAAIKLANEAAVRAAEALPAEPVPPPKPAAKSLEDEIGEIVSDRRRPVDLDKKQGQQYGKQAD